MEQLTPTQAIDRASKLRDYAATLKAKADALEAAGSQGQPIGDVSSEIVELTNDIRLEAGGVFGYLMHITGSYLDLAACTVISKFNLPEHVPDQGTISFEDLAKKSGAPLDQLKRIVRHAILLKLFTEPTPGQVGHSLPTRVWKSNKVLAALMATFLLDHLVGVPYLPDALAKWGDGQEPKETAMALGFRQDKTYFDIMTPEMVERFNFAMRLTSNPAMSHSRRRLYPWEGINVLVDIGGGEGQIAIDIAKEHPHLKAIVLDLKDAVATGEKNKPAEVADRVSFKAHDFFKDSPPEGADAYFLSHVFHNWPDKYCVKIAKSIVPQMKPGAKILIAESIMPKPGDLNYVEQYLMSFKDMQMMMCLNAKERSVDQITAILQEADPRLQLKKEHFNPYFIRAGSIVEYELVA